MKRLTRSVPVYTGDLPYMFVCFADRDAERIQPALRRLHARGCRLWFTMGKPKNSRAYRLNSKRISDAGLAVLFLTDNARNDTAVKGDIRHFLNTGKKVVVIELDPGESHLSLGLPEELPVVENDEALLRAEGFGAHLIGEPPSRWRGVLKAFTAVMLALALAVAVFIGVRIAGGKTAVPRPEEVTQLRLKTLPESAETLEKYPNLEKLIVPQSLAEEALDRFGGYTLVIEEG